MRLFLEYEGALDLKLPYEEYEKKTVRRKENHDTRSGRRVRS